MRPRRRVRYVPAEMTVPPLRVRALVEVPGCPWPLPVETVNDGQVLADVWGGQVVPAGKDETP